MSFQFTWSEVKCSAFPSQVKFLSDEQGSHCVGGTFEISENRFLAWRFWGSVVELLDMDHKSSLPFPNNTFSYDFRSPVVPSPDFFLDCQTLFLFVMTTENLHRFAFSLSSHPLYSTHPDTTSQTVQLPRGISALGIKVYSSNSVAVNCGNASIYLVTVDGATGAQVEINETTFAAKFLPGFFVSPASYRILSFTVGGELIYTVATDGNLRICSSAKILRTHNLMEGSHSLSSVSLKYFPALETPLLLYLTYSSSGCSINEVRMMHLDLRSPEIRVTSRSFIAPQEELIDFVCGGGWLWVLSSSPGEVALRRLNLSSPGSWELAWLTQHQESFVNCRLDEFCPQDLFSSPDIDESDLFKSEKRVAKFFLDRIFLEDRFLAWIIEEELTSLRNRLRMKDPTSKSLRQRVSSTISWQIEQVARERNIISEGNEMFNLVCEYWLAFIRGCIDVSRLHKTYLGIGTCRIGSGICIVQSSVLSLVQPCDVSQRLFYTTPEFLSLPSPGNWPSRFLSMHSFSSTIDLNSDIDKLLSASRLVFLLTQDEFGPLFAGMEGILPVNLQLKVVQHIDGWLFENELHEARVKHRRLDSSLVHLLSSLDNPIPACTELISRLNPSAMDIKPMVDGQGLPHWLIESVSSYFRQIVWARFSLVKELFVFFTYLCHTRIRLSGGRSDRPDIFSFLNTSVLPQLLTLVQAYNLLNWLGNVSINWSSERVEMADEFDDIDMNSSNLLHHDHFLLSVICRKAFQDKAHESAVVDAKALAVSQQDVISAFTYALIASLSICNRDLTILSVERMDMVINILDELKQFDTLLDLLSMCSLSSESRFQGMMGRAHLSIGHSQLAAERRQDHQLRIKEVESLSEVSLKSILDERKISYKGGNSEKKDLVRKVIASDPQTQGRLRRGASSLHFDAACQSFSRMLAAVELNQITAECFPILNLFSRLHKAKDKGMSYCIRLLDFVINRLTMERVNTTLDNIGFIDSSLCQLRSALFEYNLTFALSLSDDLDARAQLFDNAYVALISIESPARLHLLKRFVVTLSVHGDIDILCCYPWSQLRADVESELKRKARVTSLVEQETICNFYRVLYCFLVDAGNYRSAAEIMFSFALRVELETGLRTASSMRVYADALLMVLNSLGLCQGHQWLMAECLDQSRRHHPLQTNFDAPMSYQEAGPVIFSLEDIRSQYYLSEAQLLLASNNESLPSRESPADLVVALVKEGNVDMAVSLALFCEVDLRRLFQNLAKLCVQLHLSVNSPSILFACPEPMDLFCIHDSGSITSICPALSRCDQAWKILRSLLVRYDTEETNFEYRSIVAASISNSSISNSESRTGLPAWLIEETKSPTHA
jgi:hypothetical protein